MSFFTVTEAKTAASRTVQKQVLKKSFRQTMNESVASAKDQDHFDVFLSHSVKDAEIVLGVKTLLEETGLKVYVDWHYDSELSRENVNKETADLLRKRMRQSKCLIYIATDNSSQSKWMPWEVGYFDAFRGGGVAILPLLADANATFQGQEYLGLYPLVTKDQYVDTGVKDIFVEDKGARWTTFKSFGQGSPNWKGYSRFR